MSTETTNSAVSNLRHVNHERADIRIQITVKRNPQTGKVEAYVSDLNVINYEGLIKNMPLLLQDFDLNYGIDKIAQTAIIHASIVAQ